MDNLAATGGVPGPGGHRALSRSATSSSARRGGFPDRVAVTDGARRVTYVEIERDRQPFLPIILYRVA